MRPYFATAPAKLNLVLKITGRRADGYHLLRTLFHAIDLHDDLWLARAATGLHLTTGADDERAAVPPGPDNLVVRAVGAFCAAAGIEIAFKIHLHKRIPHGGGLGGGSSDAATTLRLLQAATGSPLSTMQLHEIARGLGADVAFFLRGGSQWGCGVGDELTPAEGVPDRHFVLLVPPFPCPTAGVYKNYAAHLASGAPQGRLNAVTDFRSEDCLGSDKFENDLAAAAERICPELAVLRARLSGFGFPDVHMTGSGSTLFLAFPALGPAHAAVQTLLPLTADGVRLFVSRSVRADVTPPLQADWPEVCP
ncbi:MAG: 4-(cytidine 5'-diphospho)-2-C-methyl-D-erythritol kinase [Planctomycetes bacterium]|nr:4-(cytidine 5'-diphospho)-2-C-methyl-D-erythritol kinase [Planctomycetota bacterium]